MPKKIKTREFVCKFGGQEITIFIRPTRDGFYYGFGGSNEHLTHLNVNGKFSLHKTKNRKGGEKKVKQILSSVDQNKILAAVNKDLEERVLGEKYLGNDLFLLDENLLRKIISDIRNPVTKTETSKKIKATLDIENFIIDLTSKLQKGNFLIPIKRSELSKYNGKMVTNDKNQHMLIWKGEVRILNNFMENLFTGKSGEFFGYSELMPVGDSD